MTRNMMDLLANASTLLELVGPLARRLEKWQTAARVEVQNKGVIPEHAGVSVTPGAHRSIPNGYGIG